MGVRALMLIDLVGRDACLTLAFRSQGFQLWRSSPALEFFNCGLRGAG
jgi:hypothetical protein